MGLMGGKADRDNQSNWTFDNGLVLTLYVDDILLSGPSGLRKGFWESLQKHLEIEEPTQVDRCLGRKHLFKRENGETEVYFDMVDFINSACQMYENLSGMPFEGRCISVLARRFHSSE